MTRFLLAALVLLITAASARAEMTGRPNIIDGNTIEIGGQRIGLYGIDAPEADQTCVADTEWRCGQQATFALARIIETHWVYCAERDRNQSQRVVAVCHLSGPGGPDVNAEMVREGWALAYRHDSTDYVPQEAEAKAAHRGMWRGTFIAPWDWRAYEEGERRAKEARAARAKENPGNCKIKGNIGAKGERVYYMPGGKSYDATQIDTSKGERWFCTEAEAQKAGWRRSK